MQVMIILSDGFEKVGNMLHILREIFKFITFTSTSI